ncbi:hypothetical protein EOW77_0022695 [Bradyrhizobium yuanmingense]|uniref:hypothetical protein n=1 Tax=Bradyrhizobium yuanmingense TaxID=108015 RepID=UPI000FE3637A|nr:hypothetical protein [Bradyrhizobium yuanmingense]TGN84261.1 hypothetical protein EOW77_0022695 [Bradyrhizobium yuanmingense]
MAAEIIEFPERGRKDRLVSSVARLEAIISEVERFAPDDPGSGLDGLLAAMERMGHQLVDLACLLLDDETRAQAQIAFISFDRQDRGNQGHVRPARRAKLDLTRLCMIAGNQLGFARGRRPVFSGPASGP